MVRVLSFPSFSTLDAVLLVAVCFLAPVLVWVIIVISFCHISYCYLLVNQFTGFNYALQALSDVIVIFAL